MKVHLRLFALARQLVGADSVEIELSDTPTIGELRRRLPEALQPLAKGVLFSIDSEYAPDQAAITQAGEVACIPPVSGG